MNRHEVIIAGGGYAGLAAARALGARAMVIDQHEIGAVQHSACAVPVVVIERFGAEDAIIQQYHDAYFHDPRGTTRFPLRSPYCIIDHRHFCQSLWQQTDAAFQKARISDFDGTQVMTSKGLHTALAFVDATGWPGALSSRVGVSKNRRTRLTIAIEADVPGTGDGLHIYYDPKIVPKGYGWVFPAANELRIGVGSYDRSLDLRTSLARFLERLGLDGRPVRGGMIPWFSGTPVVGNVFLAGDSAGHCLPLTAEGIRLALGFGDAAGHILRRFVDGEIDLASASNEYRSVSQLHRRSFAALRASQLLVGRLPIVGIHALARGLATKAIQSYFLHTYFSLGAESGRAA